MTSSNDFKVAITAYIFVVIPFIVLVVVKVLTGRYADIWMTGDWSIASAMIYSSSIFNVRSATKDFKGKLDASGLEL